MDHLHSIALFVRAAETGSFTAAARDLGVTPSAVSKTVARLEAKFGVRLFSRTARAVALTEEGIAFFERCRAALADIEAAEDALLRRRAAPRGTLRVSMPVTFGCRVVAPLLPAFAERYPEVSIESVLTDRISDLVEERLDVVIRTGPLENSGLIARKLMSARLVACASPAYLKRRGTPSVPEDLAEHDCLRFIMPETNRTYPWVFQRANETVTVVPTGRLAFNNTDAMLRACEAGAGIALKQDYMAADALRAGRLVAILEEFAADGGPISAVYLPGRHLSPKIRAFIEFLSEHLRTPVRGCDGFSAASYVKGV